jgi:UDP-glucose 4-epimerase
LNAHAESDTVPNWAAAAGRSPNYADASLAKATLGWTASRGIDQMCSDAWRWQRWAAKHLKDN